MKKFKFINLTIALVFSIIFIFTLTSAHAADSTVYYTHQGGQDRYETCRKLIYRNIIGDFNYAVLVSGGNYPDSLSAAPLAKHYDAPIILLPVNSNNQSYLDNNTIDLLKKRGVKQVFIIGGTGVIPNEVERTLTGMRISTTRISGQDRYETSIKVAKKLPVPSEVFVTTGEDFKDALSISSIAAKKEAPIVLVPPSDVISDNIKSYFDENKSVKTHVVAGKDLISDTVVNQLPNAVRIDGTDAYERNSNVIHKFNNELNFTETYIASGEGFADGLSASVIAAKTSSPIILIKDPIPIATSKLINSKFSDIKHITVLGGEGSVSNNLLNSFGNLKEHPYLNEVLTPHYAAFDPNNRDFYKQDNFTCGSKTYYGFQMANSYNSNLNTYMSFNLNQKYTSITGKVGITRYGNEGILKVYGDDALIKEYKVNSLDDLVNMDINVEDIDTLRFVFVITKGSTDQNSNSAGLAFIDTKIK